MNTKKLDDLRFGFTAEDEIQEELKKYFKGLKKKISMIHCSLVRTSLIKVGNTK